MKLPFKYIAILVIVSLAGIFAYQAYWLTGLYHTMHSEMERDITEAMRMSDYNEMMIRVDKMKQDDINHGEVSVSAGYSDDGKSFVRSSTTISREDSLDNTTLHETFMPKGDSVYVTHPNDSTRVEVSVRKNVPLLTKEDSVLFIDQHRETDKVRWMSADSARERLEEAVKDSDSSPQSALSAKGGLDVILRDQNSMLELATYLQRGLHSGLDIISDPDVVLYDSLLTSFLHDRNINLPHRLLHLHKGSKWDSTILYIDTLVNIGTPGYVPTSKAVEYNYSFDINTNQSYRLIMEPAGMLVLRQMSGILTTSFVILIVLAFSFWFLIRTILKQKTLEEMKSDFTNNITHELKTPIAVAYAANDALLNFNQAEEKAQRDKYLRICQEQLQRLSGLVEQILSMSMERRRTFRLPPEEFAIRDLLEPLIEQHKLKADSSVHISVDIEPEDLSVLADRTHFSNIISNLIDNAIKYSHGEAEVAIHCRKVTVEGQNEQTEISVSDHGIGIAPEKQKALLSIDDSALQKGKGKGRSAAAKEGQGSSKQADKEKRPRERKRDAAAVEVPTDVLHPELYNRLVAWRNAEASALGLPVYTVIQQKAILGISNLLPSDKAMLVRIPYFGKKGAEKYGDVILEMVRVYRKEKGLAEPELL